MFIGVDKFDDVWYNALSINQDQNKSKSSFVTYHAFVFYTPPSSLSYKMWKTVSWSCCCTWFGNWNLRYLLGQLPCQSMPMCMSLAMSILYHHQALVWNIDVLGSAMADILASNDHSSVFHDLDLPIRSYGAAVLSDPTIWRYPHNIIHERKIVYQPFPTN